MIPQSREPEVERYVSNRADKKEERTTLPLRVSSLPKETIARIGLEKEAALDRAADQPPSGSERYSPIPPRPRAGGKGAGANNIYVALYYDKHRAEMEAEAERDGQATMLKRWGVPYRSWIGLKKKWARQDTGIGKKSPRVKAKTKTMPGPSDPAVYASPVPTNDRELAIFLLGWQAGSQETMRRQT